MDAAKYFKERKRMLNSLGRKSGVCDGLMCSNCPLIVLLLKQNTLKKPLQ